MRHVAIGRLAWTKGSNGMIPSLALVILPTDPARGIGTLGLRTPLPDGGRDLVQRCHRQKGDRLILSTLSDYKHQQVYSKSPYPTSCSAEGCFFC
jgi:hypothetical protein